MGNLSHCTAPLFTHFRQLFNLQHTIISEPKHIRVEGLYTTFRLIKLFEPNLLEVEFESNLSGIKQLIRRCFYITNLPSEASREDVISALSRCSQSIMYINQDCGYLYLGTVSITVDDITYSLADYIGMMISARWEPPIQVATITIEEQQTIQNTEPIADPEYIFPQLPRPKLEIFIPPADSEYSDYNETKASADYPTPTGDSEQIISKSIDEKLEIIENAFGQSAENISTWDS